jgi:hypothetical protein
MLAPMTGSPFSSTTFPLTVVVWAYRVAEDKLININKTSVLQLLISLSFFIIDLVWCDMKIGLLMVLGTYLERVCGRRSAKIVVELSFNHVVELIGFYLSEIKRSGYASGSDFSMEKSCCGQFDYTYH